MRYLSIAVFYNPQVMGNITGVLIDDIKCTLGKQGVITMQEIATLIFGITDEIFLN